MVWRVAEHGFTTGRDSGYPTLEHIGPIFGTFVGANDEVTRLLEFLPENRREVAVQQIDSNTGRYTNNTVMTPVYEAVKVDVLTQAQADGRQQEFLDQAQARVDAQIARLEAQADALRANKG